MSDCICNSLLLCLEEHGFYLMFMTCLASRVIFNPNVFTVKILEKKTYNGTCLRCPAQEGVASGQHLYPENCRAQHVRSIVDLEYPVQGRQDCDQVTRLGCHSNRPQSAARHVRGHTEGGVDLFTDLIVAETLQISPFAFINFCLGGSC